MFEVHNRVERFRIVGFGGEESFLNRFLQDLQPTDVVYDIGASVGLMTVTAARVLTEGRVIAFEPDPETRSHLFRNVELNGSSNVEFVSWAASDEEGTFPLFTDGADGFAPSLRRQARPDAPRRSVDIRTRRIDDALAGAELPVPSVLKIDIEGAEGLCLEGARGLLTGRFGSVPRLVFLELHPDFLPDFGSSVETVEELMSDAGYDETWRSRREDQVHVRYRHPDVEPGD